MGSRGMKGTVRAVLLVLISLSLADSLHVRPASTTFRPSVSAFEPPRSNCISSPPRVGRSRRLAAIRGGAASGLGKLLASAGGLATSAGVTGAANFFGLLFTLVTGSHKLTDLVGSGCFVLSALATLILGEHTDSPRLIASTSLISVWSIRLASFLFYRILKTEKDDRLGKVFATTQGTVVFWTLSFLWGFVVLLPHSMSSFAAKQAPMDGVGIAASGVAALAFVVEAVADWQKWNFKLGPDGKKKWCAEGLWGLSRHPNYAGEMTFWWAIFALNAPNLSCCWANVALGAVSPVFITSLLLWVSGVNLAEARNDEKYGENQEYLAYKKNTPLLFPGL
mmetsp:Transcript_19463/g.37859  ORF Transcript_19463/g.37859 Transcript_19463/m.37859 type:complete len:337 (+) Transcript_19463:49-1059(+)|eukprot:CAMPEP_0173390062 /NCGR_PEP_ID=MMETSP1356-20130122/14275_1 /TAXON_ID=77927 ORGANISM="Hemiselmis virescens, Strain PCC157" /NCGR_SAMPLE_ID=MMETSP1356 /ASSEMBLY_ACC=CAM_ASM_000847 /LENGTH=336 /DNA_ID=CAMNT_0014347381 /DNA_START=27 /DNA_END=1037 /DNA_ORIENTATION=+